MRSRTASVNRTEPGTAGRSHLPTLMIVAVFAALTYQFGILPNGTGSVHLAIRHEHTAPVWVDNTEWSNN
jgi:hypothetical protein